MKHHSIFLFLIFCCLAKSGSSQHSDQIEHPQHALIAQADSLMTNFQFEKALGILQGADSVDKEILLRIGQCNFRLGASAGAIEPFERVLHFDSANITALNHLGQLYARDGDFTKALSCFVNLIQLDSANGYYFKQAGAMATRLNEISRAQHWYTQALRLNARDTESSVALANTLMVMEQYKRVDSIVQAAMILEPSFKPLILLNARSAFEQRQYGTVVGTLNRLLENTDTTALTARLLGISYFHLGEYEKLISCMQFLLTNKYDFEWVYYYTGVAFRELGDAKGSVSWLKLAVEKSISENTSVYYAQLGQSYEGVGDHSAAIKAYRAAYEFSKDGILLYHLARNYDVYYKDKTTAVAYYQRYLESDDTIRLAREYAKKRMQDMGHF
jgi:tetratricopeptide (TPR) repeat protein